MAERVQSQLSEGGTGRSIFLSRLLLFSIFGNSKNFHNSTGRLKSTTREKLLGGSAELDLVVYPVGQVRLLARPRLAEAVARRDPLHVLVQAQRPQDVHGSCERRERR